MTFLPTIFAIGIGATIGASMRYYLTIFASRTFSPNFPYGTLSVNIIGSFLAGILVVIIIEKAMLSEGYRLLLLIGFTGSLTTMSALSLESVKMLGMGDYAQASLNIGLNLILSLSAAAAGVILTRLAFN
ncbi:MAG: fluoride efflux transporter CrcB [Candidatus Thioglobus sp.]|nr:MAG: fluoride efflux transporter CrcB [Candidatus Thioglobus sp.]KAA0449563.1 MAG: fluoride efflux transporter CrcB [Candidatus Thioglobus sp.]